MIGLAERRDGLTADMLHQTRILSIGHWIGAPEADRVRSFVRVRGGHHDETEAQIGDLFADRLDFGEGISHDVERDEASFALPDFRIKTRAQSGS